jgi:hypothetical protein
MTMDEAARLIRLGRKAEQRGKAIKGCLTAALKYFGITIAMRAWFLMLALGVIHAEVLPAVQPIGYWWACLLTFLLTTFLPPIHSRTKSGATA